MTSFQEKIGGTYITPSANIEGSISRGEDLPKDLKQIEISVTGAEETDTERLPSIPWTYKWIAMACVVCFPIGTTWTQASLGPLKNTLRNELGINNTQFGVIAIADSFVNTIFPIIGGMILDWWGPNPITLSCTIIILIGSVVAAVATNLTAWRVLVAGHIVMGFGQAVLDSAQQKFMYHWFGASGLALAFGLENAISSTVSLIAGMVAVPIRDNLGWYGWSFWIPACFCAASVIVNLAYIFFERFYIPRELRLTSARAKALSTNYDLNAKRAFSWDSLLHLPWQYLMLPGTQLLQSGAANSFSVSAADMIRMKGYSEAVSGFMSTGQKVIRILMGPIVGCMIDRFGHRFHYVAFAPLLYVTANALIGFSGVHPLVALVFAALAGSINGLPLQACITLLVADQNKLGTAFGLWKSFTNSHATIMEVTYGALQDGTENMEYHKVLKVGIAIKAVGFAIGIAYIIVDHRLLGKGMTLTRNQREKRLSEITDMEDDPLIRRNVYRPMTVYVLCVFICVVATAWVLFIKFLI